MQPFLASLCIATPEAVLAAAALVLLMLGVFRGDRSLTLVTGLAVAAFALAGLSLIDDPLVPQRAFGGLYVADAFSAFEETGVFDLATANRFLDSILVRGGSRDPLDAFVEFRGRRPDVRALLKQHGIAAPDNRVA